MAQHQTRIASLSGRGQFSGSGRLAARGRSPQFGQRRYQAGLGALGWLVVLGIASFGLTCFFKIGPIYLDYWNTKKAIEVVVNNGKAASMSGGELKRAVQAQLDVSLINTVNAEKMVINNVKGGRELDASYEKRVPLLANIDVVVKFDKLKYTLLSANE